MAVSPVVGFKPNQVDVFQISDGCLWHKYFVAGGWYNECIAGPAGGKSGQSVTLADAVPQFSVEVGEAFVTAEDTGGDVWVFNQPIAAATWGAAKLP